eukprot:31479-Pelagococcus_subviridis.AAC.5
MPLCLPLRTARPETCKGKHGLVHPAGKPMRRSASPTVNALARPGGITNTTLYSVGKSLGFAVKF